MVPSRLPILLTAIAIGGALVGCGSGNTRTVTTSPALNSAEFAAQAEAICARGRIQGLRYRGPRQAGQSEQEAVAGGIEASLLPAIQRVVDKIYALGAPKGEEARVERFLTALQQAVTTVEGIEEPSLKRVEQVMARAGRLARKQGLESCVYGLPG